MSWSLSDSDSDESTDLGPSLHGGRKCEESDEDCAGESSRTEQIDDSSSGGQAGPSGSGRTTSTSTSTNERGRREGKQKRKDERDRRPECKYGRKCYRKNPLHLQQFRHPGASSSSSDEEKSSPPHKKLKTGSPSAAASSSSSSSSQAAEPGPYAFFLTKVSGIAARFNQTGAVHISDILSAEKGKLLASAQFNYMIDIPWLRQQYPQEARGKPLLIVHGDSGLSKVRLQEETHHFSNIQLCQARLEIMYGTHHSKMMFLLFEDGLQIVIHTANLIQQDWHQKTQGVWLSPRFPKLSDGSSPSDGDSPTHFKADLLAYLAAYKKSALDGWRRHIQEHDMSEARVHIVASVPGRHQGGQKNQWGHLKLRQVFQERGPPADQVKGWPVIGQFSSIGSLGADAQKWLCGEWLSSLAAVKGKPSLMMGTRQPQLQLIYPSVNNVRTSLEGYPAGGSLPYSINTARKQPYLNKFLHQWSASARGRTRASPHIKTYTRTSPDYSRLAWFLVTSANLSKAAWGALEKNGAQLMIRSYEIGVLFLPQDFGEDTTFAVHASNSEPFPIPYDLPPLPYGTNDQPWVVDIPYVNKPDSHGCIWQPS
ncbi:tyrosyl-DNA phosphodiesterase 1-like [Branchiostoma floridae]|uniref:Tyrosyl-DNA phosphodiesterase 1-like n=1 Tax=Branchiostoma floridae TaxID=7739 RepID=A0A9J7M3F3_BRAFL|nr:tyrosyl-DNA phosphodiesterase 1-like [Branchiostoma floridae]